MTNLPPAEAIFFAAAALPPADRRAYLSQACAGNDSLRQRVEQMLAAQPIVGDFLEPMPGEAKDGTSAHVSNDQSETVDHGDPTARIGSIVAGKYKLIEEIGEGGMGSVYLAQQTEPVKRAVAVKVIKAGMDSKAVLVRFEAERQALAMMDHPNIAKVLDAGTTDGGRPFFVMELVKGTPITQFSDDRKLTTRQRLELFVPVCQAIQHAHQKGIIHRDIKPSNVLIAMYDDRAVPKVIDFGVAKAAGQTLTDKTLMTGFGAVVGTPEYMSPEQANLNNMDIDTRSDVYSLGVLLYELLTGTTPVDRKSLDKAALLEILRIVREVDVPRPSAKLSTIDTLPSVAANRGTEPAKLSKLMKGELDWVLLKALEKDRMRRYETANGLARDIERYLADEVVEARPPSAGYRLKKFVKRNKSRVVAAVVVLFAMLGGIVGTTYGMIRAEDEKRRAVAAESVAVAAAQAEKDAKLAALEAQGKAEKARDDEKKARETTADQRRLALDTVRDVLLRVDDLMKNDAKLAPLRVEIIHRMLEDVDRIRDHAIKNPLEDRTEAVAYSRIGDIYFKTNRIKDSVEWHRKARSVLKLLVDETPNDPNALRNLAAINHLLADAEWRFGNGARSRELHTEAVKLQRHRRSLLKDPDEMERADSDFSIAESLAFIAYDDLRLGDPDKAVQNYLAADAAFVALPPPLPNFLKVRRMRCEIQVRLGDARSRLYDIDGAKTHYQTALADREKLQRSTPRPKNVASVIKTDVGQSRMYLGDFYLMVKKDPVSAFGEYAISLNLFQEQLKEEPDHLDLRQRVGAAHYRMGVVLNQLKAVPLVCGAAPVAAMANRSYSESLRLRRELAAIDRTDAQGQIELILSLARLGEGDEAERLIRGLLDQAGNDRQVLLQIACGLGVLSATMKDRTVRYRTECFQILNKLIDNGWRDAAAFDQDPDLDTIRDDPRYGEVLKRVKK
jgi:serine/threonine protein kinase/tetratricopeptide (TPR) repeat protein